MIVAVTLLVNMATGLVRCFVSFLNSTAKALNSNTTWCLY
uniref:G-protein coupled receptors family 1 profile domain-containing protein n=1 Tax=Anguilla anguilla TaxID=7936 RepID=A0A0E9R8H8_ANGAN